jgi:3,4-dihydroxy 2-butanone 4-phosphate synthase/GTP cyclohydrolase II
VHFALQKGEITADDEVMIRVHMRDVLSDVIGGQREGFPLPLSKAMKAIEKEGQGIIVILSKAESTEHLVERMQRCQQQDQGGKLPEKEPVTDIRTFGVGAQILSDLGVTKMRIIGTPMKMHALAGFGLEVAGHVKID